MSKLVATIHAYDSLQQIRWTVTIRDYHKGGRSRSEVVYRTSGVYPSTGEDIPKEWWQELLLHMAHMA